MNFPGFEAKSIEFDINRLICIRFRNKLKISRTRVSFKIKIFFSNNVTYKVCIKIKIVSNGCVVAIILINNNVIHSI